MLWNQRNLPKQVVRYMETGHLDAPSILDIPQMEWDSDTKACVLDYMFSGENFIATSMKGAPKNAFTGCDLVEALANFGDGCWQWRGDLPLYIRDYNIAVPEEFIQHVLARMQENPGLYKPLFDWRRRKHPYEPFGALARKQKRGLL